MTRNKTCMCDNLLDCLPVSCEVDRDLNHPPIIFSHYVADLTERTVASSDREEEPPQNTKTQGDNNGSTKTKENNRKTRNKRRPKHPNLTP